jgi:hypothetical protein
MDISCSCGGANENCARCFGSGSYSSTRSSTPFRSIKQPVVKPLPTSPFSLNKGTAAQADAHIVGLHSMGRRKRRTNRQKSVRISGGIFFGCKLCENERFTERDSLASHLRDHHKVSSGPLKRILKKSRQKAARLSDAITTVPKIRANEIDRLVPESLGGEGQESSMDATKNYGFPSREQGRYGSSPSHDSYDDESQA